MSEKSKSRSQAKNSELSKGPFLKKGRLRIEISLKSLAPSDKKIDFL